jgi:hypothetical protein
LPRLSGRSIINNIKPSIVNGVRAIFGGIIGIILILAPFLGAPWYLVIFGIAGLVLSVIIAVYNFKNLTIRVCPNCGTKVQEDFGICHTCGKKLPD